MFNITDEDDLDFTPSAGSKLASLFGLEKAPNKGNTSLTYTAPKQPKPRTTEDTQSHSNKLSLIIVKEVHAFKLEDGNYSPHGKSGAALVGNDTVRIFRLLLYKGKQQIFTSATISPSFQYTVLPNMYASFYDSGKQNWSIVFESQEDSMEFARQVGVARFKSFSPSDVSPLCQELFPGTGKVLKGGDSVSLSLKAITLSLDSSYSDKHELKASFNHKLADVGWAAGLVGALPGSCRLLLLPQNIEIPWISVKNRSPMVVEASIQALKEEQSSAMRSSLSSQTEPRKFAPGTSGGDSAAESGCEDSSIRARGASIKEALTHSPRSSKASIISRMARMGQATLPLEGAAACNPSDSEETEEESGLHESKRAPPKARPNKLRPSSMSSRQHQPSPLISNPGVSPHISSAPPSIASSMTIVPAPSSVHRTGADGTVFQYLTSEGQLVSLNAQSTSVTPSDPSPHISMFLSEARIQNTEMRMHLNKFGDKMDQLMTKVDSLNLSSGSHAVSPVPAIGLEPSALLSSIEKLVRDNQALQTEVTEKNKKLEEQNDRIFSLLSANSKFLEQSSSFFEQKQQQLVQENLVQQNEEQSQRIQQMESQKDALENRIASFQVQLANVQGLVQSLQKCNSDLTNELEKKEFQLQANKNDINAIEVNPDTSHYQEEITSLTKSLEEQKKLVSSLQQMIEDIKAQHSEELRVHSERYSTMEKDYLNKIDLLNSQLKKQQALSAQFAESSQKLQTQLTDLEKKLQAASQVVTEKNNKETNVPSSITLNEFSSDVKALMNVLYRILSQQFVVGQSYDGGHVRSSVASTIKEQTLRFVQQLEARISNSGSQKTAELPDPNSVHREVQFINEERGDETTVRKLKPDLPNDDPEFDITLKLDSSSTSAVSSSTEPDLPPIPQAQRIISTIDQPSVVQEREPSPLRSWQQHPPPLPLFNDDEDDDEWGP